MTAEARDNDWRLEATRRNLAGRETIVSLTSSLIDALFVHDAQMPMRCPSAVINHYTRLYWRILDCASRILSPAEWRIAIKLTDCLGNDWLAADGEWSSTKVADDFNEMFGEGEWCDEVVALKALMPKFRNLTNTEFEAVREILLILHNFYSDDPIFSFSRILPALTDE
ncbi:hypothetical protein [Rhodoplanes sp. SY1]|uniref:hypothetical protein n=1 Tax=Rhodoplanes sp. SY1 TaxID=3166646 RepID=UPI0038B4DBAF